MQSTQDNSLNSQVQEVQGQLLDTDIEESITQFISRSESIEVRTRVGAHAEKGYDKKKAFSKPPISPRVNDSNTKTPQKVIHLYGKSPPIPPLEVCAGCLGKRSKELEHVPIIFCDV